MKRTQIEALKQRLAEVTPAGWRARLTTDGQYVVYTVNEAPVDLLAVDRVAYPDYEQKAGYAVICPTAYENHWDDASEAIIRIWRVLSEASRFRKLWIGEPSKPFVVRHVNL